MAVRAHMPHCARRSKSRHIPWRGIAEASASPSSDTRGVRVGVDRATAARPECHGERPKQYEIRWISHGRQSDGNFGLGAPGKMSGIEGAR